MRRFRIEICSFVTNAALSADFGAIKEPEGEERMLRTARCGRMLAEMRYSLRCLQNFYKYRTAPLLTVSHVISSLEPRLVVSDGFFQIRAVKIASQPAKMPCHDL